MRKIEKESMLSTHEGAVNGPPNGSDTDPFAAWGNASLARYLNGRVARHDTALSEPLLAFIAYRLARAALREDK